MAAFNFNEFNTPPTGQATEALSYVHRTYGIGVYEGAGSTVGGQGPVPYCTRYSPSGSTAFLYIQTDRTLITSGAMTTPGNYTIIGTSAPTVTAVTFTTGKNYIRLTLSGILTPGNQYYLKVAGDTFGDGSVFNVGTPVPIFIDYPVAGVGVSEVVNVGTPVMA